MNPLLSTLSNDLDKDDPALYLDPKHIDNNIDKNTQTYLQDIKNDLDPLFQGESASRLRGLLIDSFNAYMFPIPDNYVDDFLDMIFATMTNRIRGLVLLKKQLYYERVLRVLLTRLNKLNPSNQSELYESIHKRILDLANPRKQMGGITTRNDFLYPLNMFKFVPKTVHPDNVYDFVHSSIYEGVSTYLNVPPQNVFMKAITPNLKKICVKILEDTIINNIQSYDYEQCVILFYAFLQDEFIKPTVFKIIPTIESSNTLSILVLYKEMLSNMVKLNIGDVIKEDVDSTTATVNDTQTATETETQTATGGNIDSMLSSASSLIPNSASSLIPGASNNTSKNKTYNVPNKINPTFIATSLIDHLSQKTKDLLESEISSNQGDQNSLLFNLRSSIHNRVNKMIVPSDETKPRFNKLYTQFIRDTSVVVYSIFDGRISLAMAYSEMYNKTNMNQILRKITSWADNKTIDTQDLKTSLFAQLYGNVYPPDILEMCQIIMNAVDTSYKGRISTPVVKPIVLKYTKPKSIFQQNNALINHLISQLWFSPENPNVSIEGNVVTTKVWGAIQNIFESTISHSTTKDEVGDATTTQINKYTSDILYTKLPNIELYGLFHTNTVNKHICDLLMIHTNIIINRRNCDGKILEPPLSSEISDMLIFSIFSDLRNQFLLSGEERENKTLSKNQYENITIYANHNINMSKFFEIARNENVSAEYVKGHRLYQLYNQLYNIPMLSTNRIEQTTKLPPRGYKMSRSVRGGKKYATRRILREQRPSSKRYTIKYI